MEDRKYQWDEAKRAANIAERGIDFDEVRQFDWENALYELSVRCGERRYLALGHLKGRVELHAVIYTMRGAYTRIISARPASRRERERYAQA